MWWVWWIILALASVRAFNWLRWGKCYADTVMAGRVALVAGGGAGHAAALELARRGARVVLAGRGARRAAESVRRRTGNPSVRGHHLDLTSLRSVRRFVHQFTSEEAKLDVLVSSADAMCARRERTEDGIMNDMQINHFGPFLLTVLLVPMLRASAPSRVVVVSSAWHRLARPARLIDDECGHVRAYANSKLCNILFCKELARRLAGSGVVANSVNPGLVNTALYGGSTLLERMRGWALYPFAKSPEEGAQTAIYLAVSDDCDQVSGKYFEDCREARAAPAAEDPGAAARLWALSAELVKLSPEEAI